jgi:LysR family transcriptional regulator, hydrogen peroxide-inducible genes activator
MEINQLKYFLAVVEHGGFNKAAGRCYSTQSTLSEQIQRLENELGKLLLDRSHRKVVPTEAGKALVGRAKRILAQVEITRREILKADHVNTGKVAFGILPTIAPYFLPSILKTFQNRCPKIRFTFYEDTTARLLQLIEDNKLDFAITSLPIRENGFETTILFTEELWLALSPEHLLVEKEKIVMNDLRNEHFIILQDGHCLGDQVLDFCNRHDFHPRVAVRSGQLETIQALVKAGVGISLIPKMAIDEKSKFIIYRPLENPRPKRVIVAVARAKRPLKAAAQEFLAHLRESAKIYSRNHE